MLETPRAMESNVHTNQSRKFILKFTPCSIYCDKRKWLIWFPSLEYIQTYTTRMGTKCTAQQQWPIWLLLSGSREQERNCFFSSSCVMKTVDGYIKSEPHKFSAKKNCQIRLFQMTFLLEANNSWWLNGARSHQCSDLSAEMRHQAEENISMLSVSPPVSKDLAILLLSQQTAASWDPNR